MEALYSATVLGFSVYLFVVFCHLLTLMDTPIINQPRVAILGTGALAQRPVVISDPRPGEVIAIRDIMDVALSYDHRLIDGAEAAEFLSTLKARLEQGDFGESSGSERVVIQTDLRGS